MRINNTCIIYLLVALALFLVLRIGSMSPTVVDEMTYKLNAYNFSLNEVQVPNYLYFIFYKSTKYCGNGWLYCARIQNIFWFLLGVFCIYCIAARFFSNILCLLLAALVGLSPVSSVTAYFMPEAMYFGIFWLFSMLMTSPKTFQSVGGLFLAGTVLSCLSMVKPHAIFIMVPSVLFVYFVKYFMMRSGLISSICGSFVFVFAFFVLKFAASLIIYQKPEFQFFGNVYSGYANNTFVMVSDLYDFAYRFLRTFFGHVISLTFYTIIGVPIILVGAWKILSDVEFAPRNVLILYVAIVSFSLVCVVAGFSSLASYNEFVEANRLHMRYYNFILPGVVISILLLLDNSLTDLNRRTIAIATTAILAIALYNNFFGFSVDYVDAPEMFGLVNNRYALITALFTAFVMLWTFVFKPAYSRSVYIYSFSTLVLISAFNVGQSMGKKMIDTPWDTAARAAANLLTYNDQAKLLMVSSKDTMGMLLLSKIYFDNPNVNTLALDSEKILTTDFIPDHTTYLMIINPIKVNFAYKAKIQSKDFDFYILDQK